MEQIFQKIIINKCREFSKEQKYIIFKNIYFLKNGHICLKCEMRLILLITQVLTKRFFLFFQTIIFL